MAQAHCYAQPTSGCTCTCINLKCSAYEQVAWANLFQDGGIKVGMQAHHAAAAALRRPQLRQHLHACPGKVRSGCCGARYPLLMHQLHQTALCIICITTTQMLCYFREVQEEKLSFACDNWNKLVQARPGKVVFSGVSCK